jgi:hypothetical protein
VADQSGLRVIGIGFGTITAVVALIAAVIVGSANPEMVDKQPAIAGYVAK